MALTYTSFATPREWASGEIVTAVNMNTYLSQPIGHLKGLGGPPTIEVSGATTAAGVEVQRLLSTSTGTSTTDFGPRLSFAYDDDTDAETELGSLGFSREGSYAAPIMRALVNGGISTYGILGIIIDLPAQTTLSVGTSYTSILSSSQTVPVTGDYLCLLSGKINIDDCFGRVRWIGSTSGAIDDISIELVDEASAQGVPWSLISRGALVAGETLDVEVQYHNGGSSPSLNIYPSVGVALYLGPS